MPQIAHRPPVVLTPHPEQEVHHFVRWLGWLLVAAVVLGGTAMIWYGIANDTTPVATENVASITQVDPYINPELKNRINLAPPSLDMIDPHESPEILKALP